MANEITKINTITLANIAKFNEQNDSDMEKFNGAEFTGTIAWLGSRAVIGGGEGTSGNVNVIQYKTVGASADTQDFGDLTSVRKSFKGTGSNITRGMWIAGITSSAQVTDTDYVTVGSTGNATDFGDSSNAAFGGGREGGSNGTLAFGVGGFASGAGNQQDAMEYFTIASTGNGTDAGDLTAGRNGMTSSDGNSRALNIGGYDGGAANVNTVDYHTFSTSADAQDHGDASQTTRDGGAAEDTSRVVYALGVGLNSEKINTIEYFNPDSPGDATDFGDSTNARTELTGASNGTLGEFFGGSIQDGHSNVTVNTCDKITIQTTGDAADTGDLVTAGSTSGVVLLAGALSGT